MEDVIMLNVGGTPYATSRDTLCRYPDSMLARMFSGDLPTRKTPDGSYFIDRDGLSFRKVLNFLRTSQVNVTSNTERSELLLEADYFQLLSVSEELSNHYRAPVEPCSVRPPSPPIARATNYRTGGTRSCPS